jgi:hypothetical protein
MTTSTLFIENETPVLRPLEVSLPVKMHPFDEQQDWRHTEVR